MTPLPPQSGKYVEVVFPLPLDATFTYAVPEGTEDVAIGHRVLAPFQRRTLTGYVVGLPSEAGAFKIKPIDAVLDESALLTPSIISLAKYMAKMYGVFFGSAIQTMLPPGLIRQSRKRISAAEKEGEPEEAAARDLLARIRKSKGLDWAALVRKTPAAVSVLRRLEKEGWISVESSLRQERARGNARKVERDGTFESAPAVELSGPQKEALGRLSTALSSPSPGRFLLHGITGSGKTEIYLLAAERVLAAGRTVLALVPEISLTPQFVGRFRARFGERVALLHSGRSESERFSEWKRIRAGEATVVIGARSAVFAPLENVGLIVVDEEHDASYKQEEGVLYNAKQLAAYRAEKENALLLYGSATPSLEIYEAAGRKEVELLELPSRVTGHDLPEVRIVDMRKEFSKFGEKGLFSAELRAAVEEALGRGEQAVLFLNRRGFAPIVLCPGCGESLRCPQCSVSLTYHEGERRHLCHHCGYGSSSGDGCAACGQPKMIYLGVGTERVEQELLHFFPDARIARMDRDTVSKKGMHEKILRSLARRETDILIGTQMVTKGLDLAHVSLAGVLLADQALHFPDFRAAEHTFQLLTQVVGRAGRGGRRGTAILQTFQPEHYAVAASAAQDYLRFYTQEIEYRKQLRYPPFSSLVLLELSGADGDGVAEAARWLGKQARMKIKKGDGMDVMGPAPAPIRKINAKTRYHLLVRSPRGAAASAFGRWLAAQARPVLEERKVSLRLDIDPYRFL